MPRLSIWDSGTKGPDYRFIDRTISEYFSISGTDCLTHLYLGPYQQETAMLNRDGTTVPAFDPNAQPAVEQDGSVSTIQDVLLLENRDRKYSDVIYPLRGIYTMSDSDFDLRQFGLFIQTDTLFIEFHLNDMMQALGRRLMPGDVIELPHRRDDTLNLDDPAINKFYVVEDAQRAASGYSATWWPHIWRCKVSPMTASQEFKDILDQQATNPLGFDQGKIGDLMSTMAANIGIDNAVVEQAKADVPARYFETRQFYMVTPETKQDLPWVFAGDGVPPNGAVLLGSGQRFPDSPQQGDYYLRTDYHPATLFMFDSGAWRMQEWDMRQSDWSAAHQLLLAFINDSSTQTFDDGSSAQTKVNLSKAVKPRADF